MDIMESLVKQLPNGLVWSGRRCRIRSGFPARRLRAVRYFLAGGIPVSGGAV